MVYYENESGKRLKDRQNIIFIDLENIRKKFGTPVNELTSIEKWGLFFSYIDKDKNADYMSELVRSEKGIMAAENTVKDMSEADDNWFIQNSRFIYERDRNTLINNAERRGREEGLQQKAVEDALMIINEFKATPEFAAQKVNIPLELVLEALKQKK